MNDRESENIVKFNYEWNFNFNFNSNYNIISFVLLETIGIHLRNA